jgi:hypothetical protein
MDHCTHRSAASRRASRRRHEAHYRPHVELLEDRSLPSTIAYQVPAGTVGQQAFNGPLGMDFNVQQSVVITELGVFDSGSDGLAVPLTATLYNRDTQTAVASLTFAAGQTGTLIDGSRFLPLATPVVLAPGFHGTIVAEGYGASEPNGNAGLQPITWTNDGGGLLQFVGSARFGFTPGAFPTNSDSGPANRYAAGTFEFSTPASFVSGPSSVFAGQTYTLNLGLSQASGITGWTIHWGDGKTDTVSGNPSQVTHVYASGGNFSIAATALSAGFGGLGTSYTDVVAADAPTAYWRLNDSAPTTAVDQTGNFNATYVNFTSSSLGQAGPLSNDPTSAAVSFNGSNQYVSLPDAFHFPALGGSTAYSVSVGVWFNTTSSGVILGQTDGTGVPGGAAPTGGWVPALYVGTDGHVYANLFWHGPVASLFSPGVYNDGQWHQVVDVYSSGVETLYLDGNAVAARTVSTVPYSTSYSYTLGVGYTAFWPATNGGWSFFNGQLSEVSVYSGGLSAQQVAAQFVSASIPRLPVTVINPIPTAFLQGPTTGVRGQPLSFTFSATSASAVEQAGPFTYTVNWGDGNIQTVTGSASGVTVSHVFTDAATDNVSLTAADQDGHTSAAVGQSVVVSVWAIETQPDPANPGQTIQVLVVGGSTGSDIIIVTPGSQGTVDVKIFEKTFQEHLDQVFAATINLVVVYGQGGDDLIVVPPGLKLPSEVFTGSSNDDLTSVLDDWLSSAT